MHSKALLMTLLAGQVALAAVIPIERNARNGVNPINGLPAPGSNLNPISGLPTPHGRKHKHSHVRLGHGGKNLLSGLPVHAREAEAEAEPVRIVTHMHTSTSVVWIHATPKPGVADKGEPDHPKQNHNSGNRNRPIQYGPNDGGNRARPSHRPRPRPGSDGTNPVNGLPAPGSPVYGKPHRGNGQGKHPKNGQGDNHPKNGQGQGNNNNAHPKQNGQGNQAEPHTHKPHTLKPGGITIRPLTSVTIHGHPTMVPIPKDKPAPQNTPAATHTTHAPPHNQPTPTHVPHLQPDPEDEPKHKGDPKGKGKGKGEGVIGKKPSRRDVDDEAVAEMPEAYGEFAEKAEQLSAFDEGIDDTDTDAESEGGDDYYTGYSPYFTDGDEADGIYERGLEGTEADDQENAAFLETYQADQAWWEEYARSLYGEDLE